MVMRITTSQRFSVALRNIQFGTQRVQDIQEKIVTGKQIIRPSDDPAGFSRITNLRRLLGDSVQFKENIQGSEGFLNVTDQVLSSIRSLVQEANTIAIGQAGAPSDDVTRAASASQVARIRESIIQLANTQVSGRYIFSGTDIFTQAFGADGAYQGNLEKLDINIALGNSIGTNVTGADFLTTDLNPDLFQTSGFVKSKAAVTDKFTIDSSNNVLRLKEQPTGTTFSVTVTAGTYSGDALAAELQKQLTNFTPVDGQYTVNYNEATDQFDIRLTGGTPTGFQVLSSGTDALSTAAAGFGFAADSAVSTVAFSDTAVAFNVITGVNDTFQVAVDGGTLTAITVAPGVYTAEGLATQLQLKINNSVKQIPATGNTIKILEDGGVRSDTLTIAAGTKTGAALATELQTALNASTVLKGSTAAGGAGYAVSYLASADKFTITAGSPAANVGVDIATGSVAGVMGFTKAVPFAAAISSDANITGAKVDYGASFKDAFTITSPTAGPSSSIAIAAGATDILPTLDLSGAVPSASRSTRLSDLNGGKGVAAGSVSVTNRKGEVVTVDLSTAVTLNDVFKLIESNVTGVKASIDADGKRIVLTDSNSPQNSNLIVAEVGQGTTAADLGIRADVPGNITGRDLNPVVTENTLASALRDGAGLSLGKVKVGLVEVDLAIGSAITVGDILTAINTAPAITAKASISANGQHLALTSTDPTKSALISDVSGKAAAELGFQGKNDLIGLLSTLEEALLRNDEKTIQESLDLFTGALERLGLAQVQIGQITRQFDRFKEQQEEVNLSFTEVLSNIEDVDMVEALTKFSNFQNSLQAALASTAQILQVQLLDFLR